MGNCVCLNQKNINQKCINVENSKKEKKINKSLEFSEEEITRNLSTKLSSENVFLFSFEIFFLKEINVIRENPKKFAIKLKELSKDIIKENNNEYLLINRNNNNKEKILLKKGKQIFDETINFLEKFSPVNKLEYNENLKIIFEEEMKLTKENIAKIILKKRLDLLKIYKNCFFCIDIFQDPFLSVVFQIIDENFNQIRRNAILNKNYSMFAISTYKDSDNNFISISCFV
jgi:hypothetical protein